MYDFLAFRRVEPADAAMLLQWRRAEHVAEQMLTEVDDKLEAQQRWLQACEAREDYHHRIFSVQGQDVGYCSITIVDPVARIGEIGAYVGVVDAPRALTIYNFLANLNHAYFTLQLHKVVNRIIDSNRRTRGLQLLNGYREVGVLKEHVLVRGVRHDVHLYEQLKPEWIKFREKYGYNLDWDRRPTGDRP